jgi:hypothetical protein
MPIFSHVFEQAETAHDVKLDRIEQFVTKETVT